MRNDVTGLNSRDYDCGTVLRIPMKVRRKSAAAFLKWRCTLSDKTESLQLRVKWRIMGRQENSQSDLCVFGWLFIYLFCCLLFVWWQFWVVVSFLPTSMTYAVGVELCCFIGDKSHDRNRTFTHAHTHTHIHTNVLAVRYYTIYNNIFINHIWV